MTHTVTLKELAAYWRVSPHAVYRLARSHKIPAFKVGRQNWRFDMRDIRQWEEQQGKGQ